MAIQGFKIILSHPKSEETATFYLASNWDAKCLFKFLNLITKYKVTMLLRKKTLNKIVHPYEGIYIVAPKINNTVLHQTIQYIEKVEERTLIDQIACNNWDWTALNMQLEAPIVEFKGKAYTFFNHIPKSIIDLINLHFPIWIAKSGSPYTDEAIEIHHAPHPLFKKGVFKIYKVVTTTKLATKSVEL